MNSGFLLHCIEKSSSDNLFNVQSLAYELNLSPSNKMKSKLLLFIILSFWFSFSFAKQPHLVLKKSFPDPNSTIAEDFLIRPIDVEIYNDYFVAVDAGDHCIKVFNKQGQYLNKIGRKGRGPGELLNPLFATIDKRNGYIYCVDDGNNRISYFSIAGNFINSFRTPTVSINDLIATDDTIFASAYNQATNSFLAMYDSKGKLLKTFGSFFDDRLSKLPYWKEFYSNICFDFVSNSIFVSFSYLPLIQVYNKNGELVKTIKLQEKNLWKFYETNLEKNNVIMKNGGYFLRGWMAGAFVSKDKFYLYYPELKGILVFKKNGEFLERIIFKDESELKTLKHFITILDDEFIFLDIMDAQIKIYALE